MAIPFLSTNSDRSGLFVNCFEPSADFIIRLSTSSESTGGTRVSIRRGDVIPTDNRLNMGVGAHRWMNVFSVNGVIQTSDARSKQDIRSIEDIERDVAMELKSLIKVFRFRDAVREKGDTARKHIGVLAQEVEEVFTKHGLDGREYGILCYDEWEREVDEEGAVTLEAGNRYGIRYEELMMFIIAAM